MTLEPRVCSQTTNKSAALIHDCMHTVNIHTLSTHDQCNETQFLQTYLNDDSHLEAGGRQSTVQSVTHHPLRETRAPTLLNRLYDICFSILKEIGLKLTYMQKRSPNSNTKVKVRTRFLLVHIMLWPITKPVGVGKVLQCFMQTANSKQ